MSLSSVFILDGKGKIIISRDYRGDVSANCVDKFISFILDDDDTTTPVFEINGINYIHVKHQNLYILAVSTRNSDASMILMFLYKLVDVLTEYFQNLEEESIRDNFVITYELLDEMMDFGYPQTTETDLLKQYITQKGHELHKAQVRIPDNATMGVCRPDGIKYRKNEVFLDVIEKVNLLFGTNGAILQSDIEGKIKLKTFLSGMPELKLGLSDRVQFDNRMARGGGKAIEMEDVQFHQCVNLPRFEQDRVISFIPPDGKFILMTYRLSQTVKPLFEIESYIDNNSSSKVEYLIKIRSNFKERSQANNVQIIVPVPADVSSPKFRKSGGDVKYAPELNSIVWDLARFPGAKEHKMSAHFKLPSITSDEAPELAPIAVKFQIPYFTVSGVQVRYLKILERKMKYTAMPWVRYITKAGNYIVRTQ
eukprot:TRINITY_DN11107_c0_g1_i1.p1 TRINITY_DN11107_c0_g1~~TRINITY_DN11107_c0_g1_i1.p1  ORF type:complete len:423 (-),score=84.70 TRINITY_DN11107_c0_g1_i1:40-1308(-)